jgi:hypothetical protein
MTEEYWRHLCNLLESYARPFRLREPVVCLDEKSGHQVEQACATARRIDLVLASLDSNTCCATRSFIHPGPRQPGKHGGKRSPHR